MAEDRFQRFRHLERPRKAGDPAAREPAAEGRIEALEGRRPAAEGTEPVAEGHLDRFRPAAERPLETAPPEGAGELPFVRCAACQMDHNRSAAVCSNCGADLRTGEQRAFNARLAAERKAQGAVEAAQLAELERSQREAGEEAARAKRQMAEELAREVGDAERRRLDAEGLGGFGSAPRGGRGGGWLVARVLQFLFGDRGGG